MLLEIFKTLKEQNGIEFSPNFLIADLLTARNGSNSLMNKSATRKYCENKAQNGYDYQGSFLSSFKQLFPRFQHFKATKKSQI